MRKSILLVVFLTTLLASFLVSGCGKSYQFTGDYEADRAGFESDLRREGPHLEAENPSLTLPVGVDEISYPSGNLHLKAWVTSDPGDGLKRPAFVFLHGGFYFDESDFTVTNEEAFYLDFITMTPMLRSENGNEGSFEYFLGEVDDAVSAGKYLAALPYVDPDNIYLYGYSAGGSLATLVSMIEDNPYKAIVTAGASYGTEDYFKPRALACPFKYNADEIHIRSAYDYADNIKVPVTAYVGGGDENVLPLAQVFQEHVSAFDVPYTLEILEGDHSSSEYEAFYRALFQFYETVIDDYMEKGIVSEEDFTEGPLEGDPDPNQTA